MKIHLAFSSAHLWKIVGSVLILVASVGCKQDDPNSSLGGDGQIENADAAPAYNWPESLHPPDSDEHRIFETNLSEDFILDLSPGLNFIAMQLRSFANESSQRPAENVFTDTIQYVGPNDVESVDAIFEKQILPSGMLVAHDWPIAQVALDCSPDKVWQSVLRHIELKTGKFGVLEGNVDRENSRFEMKTVFEGNGTSASGHLVGVTAKQTLTWVPKSNDQWKISKWKQDSLKVVISQESLFKDVTESAFPNSEVRKRLTQSLHANRISEQFSQHEVTPVASEEFRHFSDWESSFQYPSVSVVDFDGDGWEDLFVMDRWDKSILLRNKGDGSFEDVTDDSGLVVGRCANCAFFADFDNDGDPDALIGRTLEPSLYFTNEDGKFVANEVVNRNLKNAKFAVSGSVADINGDGLLDVYLSTYCIVSSSTNEWMADVVQPDEELKLEWKLQRNNPFTDRAGPPNILLINRGGILEQVKIDDTLKQWRNSYQVAWNDFDSDGDPDLYICNDFAPDAVLRNDTDPSTGQPEFVEFTKDVFPEGTMGFGMGANFGDYNGDGKLDLYISNMYSKAGLRIMKKMGNRVDPRIAIAAKGNFLYENHDGKYKQVAGIREDQIPVSKVGWSFGGQMADFDNDGRLDIYVPSGFFTPPKALASTVDL